MSTSHQSKSASSKQRSVKEKLIAARRIINKKFQKAYKTRLVNDRKFNETFKPITNKLDEIIRNKTNFHTAATAAATNRRNDRNANNRHRKHQFNSDSGSMRENSLRDSLRSSRYSLDSDDHVDRYLSAYGESHAVSDYDNRTSSESDKDFPQERESTASKQPTAAPYLRESVLHQHEFSDVSSADDDIGNKRLELNEVIDSYEPIDIDESIRDASEPIDVDSVVETVGEEGDGGGGGGGSGDRRSSNKRNITLSSRNVVKRIRFSSKVRAKKPYNLRKKNNRKTINPLDWDLDLALLERPRTKTVLKSHARSVTPPNTTHASRASSSSSSTGKSKPKSNKKKKTTDSAQLKPLRVHLSRNEELMQQLKKEHGDFFRKTDVIEYDDENARSETSTNPARKRVNKAHLKARKLFRQSNDESVFAGEPSLADSFTTTTPINVTKRPTTITNLHDPPPPPPSLRPPSLSQSLSTQKRG